MFIHSLISIHSPLAPYRRKRCILNKEDMNPGIYKLSTEARNTAAIKNRQEAKL